MNFRCTVSARGVYLWYKYLLNISHYDDEDGWLNENEQMRQYSYKNILKKMHQHFGSSCGDGEVIFTEYLMKHPHFSELLKKRNITTFDQLDYYAREVSDWR